MITIERLKLAVLTPLAIASLTTIPNALALNIALTNDDGWDSAGIQTLHAALVDAGHTVVMAAPSENQSGSGPAIELAARNLLITKQYEDGTIGGSDQYSVDLTTGGGAKPATAGQVAISIAEAGGVPVDLLISGTNAGSNIGAWTNISGTVGATIQSLSYLSGKSVPAIAISTDTVFSEDNCPEGSEAYCNAVNKGHFKRVAGWMVDFVSVLEQKPGWLANESTLLPEGVALNINYPTFTITSYDEDGPVYSYLDEVHGVTLAAQGKLAYSGGIARGFPVGCYTDCINAEVGETALGGVTARLELEDGLERAFADTTAFNAGLITIVPITVDLTANFLSSTKFYGLIKELNH